MTNHDIIENRVKALTSSNAGKLMGITNDKLRGKVNAQATNISEVQQQFILRSNFFWFLTN